MHRKIRKILDQFEKDFNRNPHHRIEDIGFGHAQFESLTPEDRKRMVRELILLEVCLRYEDRQKLIKREYEERFPDSPNDIDDAFRDIDRRRREESSDWIIEVTQALGDEEGFVVSNEGLRDIPTELGKYKQIERVGEGGFGVVCKAWDSEANEFRALKFPTKTSDRENNFLSDVKKETEKSVGLDHPNVVKTFGMEVIQPFAFVVQEFVDGCDLKTWMQQDHTVREKVQMVKQIADGLNYAHAAPHEITHCDIKPANILVDNNGNPKVADFGLAFKEQNRLGLRELIIGTPAYLSPTVAEGYIRHADGRADIFSLGVILYEMLAGRRPFVGRDFDEIREQILYRDPRPIRSFDGSMDRELDRICLRCLERRPLDRYQVASDLSDELATWLDEGPPPPPPQRQLIPRGFAPFREEDNEFFIDLLPGVRDQYNVPLGLSFWLKRIVEPVDENDRIPNGFLFGPSGSGKSSFVRAGLIPEIRKETERRSGSRGTRAIQTIYVESTRNDTEVRILNALRRRFPDIPYDISIPDVFAGLSNGLWRQGANEKILLVIDQFEQWIARDERYEESQLTKALRHCNGEDIQCLMLVRDDFFLSTLRFADTLDINLQEDENFKNIDLFDEAHARKVLIKLGQAYEKIPNDDDLISVEEREFVKKTIEQLARNHFVVCVRISLFVEMFKHREWTVEELESDGGIAGVGEQFLEYTFGEETTSPELRGKRNTVQAILEELLPEAGRNIRGTMKTREQLIAAAECEGKERIFDQILNQLHRKLTLITRTDPDASGDTSVDEDASQSSQEYYQLTHDYLVPSIRNWLNTDLRNTRRGRAIIRLRELAAQVVPGQKPKYLPGNFEWLYWQFGIRDRIKKENEKLIDGLSRRKFLSAFSIAFVLIAGIVGAYFSQMRLQKKEMAIGFVDRFMDGHPEAVRSNALLMNRYPTYSIQLLEQRLLDSLTEEEKLRANIGLALLDQCDDETDTAIVDSIHKRFDEESKNVITALQRSKHARAKIRKEYLRLISEENLPDGDERLARLLITALFLGEREWVAGELTSATVDRQNMFASALVYWHGDIEVLSSTFFDNDDSLANSALCFGIGLLIENELIDISSKGAEAIGLAAGDLHRSSEDVYFRACSEWLLTLLNAEVKRGREKADLILGKSGGKLPNSKTIWLDTIGIRLVRLDGRNTNFSAFVRGKKVDMASTLTGHFYVADRETTIKDFKTFLADKDYKIEKKPRGLNWSSKEEYPATAVSYVDAIMYCNWLSEKHGFHPVYKKLDEKHKLPREIEENERAKAAIMVPLNKWTIDPDGNGFRLPTYVEWQCIEKKDDRLKYDFGTSRLRPILGSFAWLNNNTANKMGINETQKTKQKMPNRHGLFDVYGNAAEYCWGFPFGGNDEMAVLRGGSCITTPNRIGSSFFEVRVQYARSPDASFRIVIGKTTLATTPPSKKKAPN